MDAAPPSVTLYRPVGQSELDRVRESGWRAFPPRLVWQPIFYPVLDEAYADFVARDWNAKDPASGRVGHVLRFAVRTDLLSRYDVREAGGPEFREYWIPAADLPDFNAAIVGRIE